MLTKKDVLTLGTAVCDALKKEQESPHLQGPDNQARYAARGIAVRIMADIFYHAPHKVRAQFEYSSDAFHKACGWPD